MPNKQVTIADFLTSDMWYVVDVTVVALWQHTLVRHYFYPMSSQSEELL
jgi:hypothetical protein